MNIRNRVSGTRILDEQVIDLLVLALMETNPEVRLGQGAKVVADFGVFARHVDEYVAERPLFDVLVLFRFQHAHGRLSGKMSGLLRVSVVPRSGTNFFMKGSFGK